MQQRKYVYCQESKFNTKIIGDQENKLWQNKLLRYSSIKYNWSKKNAIKSKEKNKDTVVHNM